jgi:hypothetical protein
LYTADISLSLISVPFAVLNATLKSVIVWSVHLLSAGKGPIFPNSDDDEVKEDKEEGIEGIEGIDEVKEEVEGIVGIDIDELEGIEKSKPSISV